MLPAKGTLNKASLENLRFNLKLFIETDCAYLPPHIHEFQSGGEFEHVCIMCTEITRSIIGREVNPELEIELINGVTLPLCEECAEEIDNRISTEVDSDLYRHAQYAEERLIGVRSKKGNLSNKIREFVIDFKYPKNVLNLKPWPYKLCGFCEDEITEDTYRRVQLPVDVGNIFGGFFNVCNNCADEIGSDVMPFPNEVERICSKCNYEYKITLNEERYRKNHNLEFDYICGTCFHLEHFGPDFTPSTTHEDYFRFKETECEICKAKQWIDLMTVPDRKLLEKGHICNVCKQTSFRVDLEDNYSLLVRRTGINTNWIFKVMKNNKIIHSSPEYILAEEAAAFGAIWFHNNIKYGSYNNRR
jgi:hypothetical protein